MEEPNEAWKILIESLNSQDNSIIEFKKREIELLQKLMHSEDNVRNLIKIVAELKLTNKGNL